MKTLFTILGCIISLSMNGQVFLEKGYINHSPMQVMQLEGEGYKYIGFDSAGNRVMIYNSDHSLWKTVPLSIPAGYHSKEIRYSSKYLFNSDAKVEMMITYEKTMNEFIAHIINEDGTIIKIFPSENNFYIYKIDGSWKLLNLYFDITNLTTIRGITASFYSLPGQYSDSTYYR